MHIVCILTGTSRATEVPPNSADEVSTVPLSVVMVSERQVTSPCATARETLVAPRCTVCANVPQPVPVDQKQENFP